MPIDPNLIGNTMANWQRPPVYDPLAQFAKIQALKNGIGQQQLQQQALQEGALGLQEKQKAIADQEAINDAFKSAYAPDPTTGRPTLNENTLYQGLSERGLGSHIPTIQKTITEANESAVKFKQTQAAASKAQTDASEAAQDYLAQQLLYVKDAKYNPTTFTSTLAAAIDHGAVTPAQAAQLNQRFQQNPTAEGVQALVDPLLAASPKIQDIQEKRAATAKAAADTDAAIAKAQREKDLEFLNQFGGAPDAATAAAIRDRARLNGVSPALVGSAPMGTGWTPAAAQAFANQALTQKERDEIQARAEQEKATAQYRTDQLEQGAQRVAISQQELGLRNKEYQQKYGDVLAQISPEKRAIAQKLAAGDMNPAQLSRFGDKEQLIAAAIAINPNWTQATYDTKQSFTNPGKIQARNLGTISRIVGHIRQFEKNSNDLGTSPGLGLGMNLTGAQKRVNIDSHAIAGELEKLLSGGVGTVSQVRAWQDALTSPLAGTRQQAVDEISQLIGSQYEGMNQTYKAGVGADLPVEKYVNGAGRAWMQAKGINVGGVPDLPARLSAADVGKTYVNKDGDRVTVTAVNPADPTQFRFNPAQ